MAQHGRRLHGHIPHLGFTALAAGALIAGALVGPVTNVDAATAGHSNRGDVWVDNVGQPPGPGHEMDPHLACADINLWGNGLADSSGTYTIDGWPPSGSQEQVYSDTWSYDTSASGDQVTSVIDVSTLIANAEAAGDQAQPRQGFHFKLQFSQNPQKHKTFWVDCPATPPPPPTGYLEICKHGATAAVTGNFQFRVQGKTYTVPVGACSAAIKVNAGNVTITELARTGYALAGVTTQPSSRLISVDAAHRSAVVKVVAGGVSTETIATFTNKVVSPPPTGYLEICKHGATAAVTGNFQFRVQGKTYTVPVGACSAAIKVNAGNVTISELARTGYALAGVTTQPSSRLISVDRAHRSAIVKVVAGGVSTETIATFTNEIVTGTGRLKVCEVAGTGVTVGTDFVFAAGGHSVTVPAGPAPGGYCEVVSRTFTIGSTVTVTQSIPTGDTVTAIVVAPSGRLVTKNVGAGQVTVRIGSGTTEVTYTDRG